jgi:MFS family permease
LFLMIEVHLGDRAMVPISLFQSRDFSTMNALTLLLYFALGGSLYYLPFGLIRIGGYSAMQAGAALSPFALTIGLGAPVVGAIANRLNTRLLLTLGPAVVACGFVVLAFVDFKQSYWINVFPPMLLLGSGMAMTVPPLTSIVLASVAKAQVGVASGVNTAIARVAGLLAVATLGTLFFVSFSFHLTRATSAQVAQALNAVMRGQTNASAEAVNAFRHSLHMVLLVPAICAALAGLCAWLRVDDTSHTRRQR